MFKTDYKKFTPERFASMFSTWVALPNNSSRPPYYSWKTERYIDPVSGKEIYNQELGFDSLKRMLRGEYFYKKWHWTRAIIYETINGREIFRCKPNGKKGEHFGIIAEPCAVKELIFVDTKLGNKILESIDWYIPGGGYKRQSFAQEQLAEKFTFQKNFWWDWKSREVTMPEEMKTPKTIPLEILTEEQSKREPEYNSKVTELITKYGGSTRK